MTLAMIGLGAVALTLPGMRPSLSLRGDPRWFVRLDALALVVGVAATAAGLALSAGVGAMYLVAGAALPSNSSHVAPGGPLVSILSAALLGVLGARAARFTRRLRRARRVASVEGWLGRHHDCADHDVVFVTTPTPVAYSIRGRRPQVVVSDELAALLGTELLSFVIDHERAHLRGRHHRYLVLAALTDALGSGVPGVARSALALRLAVERAADEAAAGRDKSRRRRVAAALQRLAATVSAPGADLDSLRYRAGHLRAAPAGPTARCEMVAAVGIMALVVTATAVVGHVGADLPALGAAL